MRKTLIALAAIAGLSVDNAATIGVETEFKTTTQNNYTGAGGTYNGVLLNLDNIWLSSSPSIGVNNAEATFHLNEFSYDIRSGYTPTEGIKLVVKDMTTNEFMAMSETLSHTGSGGVGTFSFTDGVELNFNANYSFLFVTSTTVLSNGTVTGGNFISQQMTAIPNSAFSNSVTDSGFVNASGVIQSSSYKPNITLSGYYSVPEPTTATLSLLGLGALLLRRRRQA